MAVKYPYHKPTTIPLYPASSVSSRQVASGRGRVIRTSFRETTGAAVATVELFDGNGTGGALAFTLQLAATASQQDRYTRGEFMFDGGLYFNLVAGAVEGVIVVQYLGPGEPYLEPMLALSLDDLAAIEGVAVPGGTGGTVLGGAPAAA